MHVQSVKQKTNVSEQKLSSFEKLWMPPKQSTRRVRSPMVTMLVLLAAVLVTDGGIEDYFTRRVSSTPGGALRNPHLAPTPLPAYVFLPDAEGCMQVPRRLAFPLQSLLVCCSRQRLPPVSYARSLPVLP